MSLGIGDPLGETPYDRVRTAIEETVRTFEGRENDQAMRDELQKELQKKLEALKLVPYILVTVRLDPQNEQKVIIDVQTSARPMIVVPSSSLSLLQ